MYHLPYHKDLKQFSRQLRNHSTLGEVLLWQQLRAGGIKGYTFNRQKPLGRYIVDFFCKRLSLVIEVDGGYHFEEEQKIKDHERQTLLESLGLHFLRFHEEEVKRDMPFVLATIEKYISNYQQQQRQHSASQ